MMFSLSGISIRRHILGNVLYSTFTTVFIVTFFNVFQRFFYSYLNVYTSMVQRHVLSVKSIFSFICYSCCKDASCKHFNKRIFYSLLCVEEKVKLYSFSNLSTWWRHCCRSLVSITVECVRNVTRTAEQSITISKRQTVGYTLYQWWANSNCDWDSFEPSWHIDVRGKEIALNTAVRPLSDPWC